MKPTKSDESLVSKISKILNPAITATSNDEDEDENEASAKVVDFNEDYSDGEEKILSNLRKKNINLLSDIDQKYQGTKCSRKSLNYEDEENDDSNDSDVAESSGNEGTEDDNSDSEKNSDNDESTSDEDDDDQSISEEEKDSNVVTLNADNSQQNKKGIAVQNQLKIWESLLEMRIELQKCLLPSNKLPDYNYFEKMKTDVEFQNKILETRHLVENLLDKFMELQRLLVKQFPDTKNLDKTELNEDDEEIPSDSENELKDDDDEEINEEPVSKSKKRKLNDYHTEIAEYHEQYAKYRNNLIDKWNSKTKLSSKKNENHVSIVNQIEYALKNMPKLIKRTQLNRGGYEILCREKNSEEEIEYDPEIFDDTDFYQQLLRELIKVKSADITDPEQLSKQWVQLQDCRNKMKVKVDTRATKGRKIRYAVHSKLVNFMAPIEKPTWSDKAKDELYSSLFGKNEIKC